jgi:hypothetical protein
MVFNGERDNFLSRDIATDENGNVYLYSFRLSNYLGNNGIGGQFYWWRKPEYPAKKTPICRKYISYIYITNSVCYTYFHWCLFTSNICWKWTWHILSTDTMHARNDAEETFGMVS